MGAFCVIPSSYCAGVLLCYYGRMDNKDIGALWSKTSGKGLEFLSGNILINEVRHEIVLFKNTRKSKPNHPDWNIFKSAPRTSTPVEPGADSTPF